MGIVISSFKDKYAVFSNFYPAIVQFEGLNFPTVEHAYQAGKSTEFFFRKLIVAIPGNRPGLAKARGQNIRLRKNWEEIKIDHMHFLLCQKFNQDPFKKVLLETDDAILIEGNRYHDNKWGDCYCGSDICKNIKGENLLGKELMEVRSQLNEKNNRYGRHSQ